MSEPVVALIVAMNPERVIGVNNTLPWHLPGDLKHFKRLTMGKPIIMGRNTWDSIGRPLPGRNNIVISRQSGLQLAGASVVPSPDAALALALAEARREGLDEVFVIGGQQVYQSLLAQVERVYLTEVEVAVREGDAWFPALPAEQWQEVERECHSASPEGHPRHCFITLQKNKTATFLS